ncbi:MAG: hypothetical protein JWN46_230 [Acidimicrobiales bacterium]|nr:hypothetical protein [Acidimicrobiales bacterium]
MVQTRAADDVRRRGSPSEAPSGAGRRPAAARRARTSGAAQARYVRRLDPVGRGLAVLLLVAAGLPALVITAIAWHRGWVPAGDNALIGLRVHDVISGHPPLIGQPSTGGTLSGVQSFHPGPFEFYAMAPLEAIFGMRAALLVGAGLINGAAMVTGAWVAFRRGGLPLMSLFTTLVVVMVWSLHTVFLHDPVSSSIGTMASLLLVLLVWSVAVSDIKLIPLFIVVGSFSLQDHLAYLSFGGPLVIVGLFFGVRSLLRVNKSGRRPPGGLTRHAVHRMYWIALALGALLWLPVFIDQFFDQGNLTSILRTFTSGNGKPKGWGFAFERAGLALAPVPVFVRQVAAANSQVVSTSTELLGLLPLIALGSLTYVARRQHRRDLVVLALVVAVALLGGMASAASLPTAGELQATNLRWMWMASLCVYLAVAWMGWQLLAKRHRRRWQRPVTQVLIGLACLAAVLVPLDTKSTDVRDSAVFQQLPRLIRDVRANVPKGSYRIAMNGQSSLLQVGPAVVAGLVTSGYHPYVQTVADVAYRSHLTYSGQHVNGTLSIVSSLTAPPQHDGKLVGHIRFVTRDIASERDALLARLVRTLPARGGLEITSTGVQALAKQAKGSEVLLDLDRLARSQLLPNALAHHWVQTVGSVDFLAAARLATIGGEGGVDEVWIYLSEP